MQKASRKKRRFINQKLGSQLGEDQSGERDRGVGWGGVGRLPIRCHGEDGEGGTSRNDATRGGPTPD